MFTAALLVGRKGKQLKCPYTGDGININNECRSAIQRDKLPIYAKTWTHFKNILMSERSQAQEYTLYDAIQLNKEQTELTYGIETGTEIALVGGGVDWELLEGDGNVPCLVWGLGYMGVRVCQNPQSRARETGALRGTQLDFQNMSKEKNGGCFVSHGS